MSEKWIGWHFLKEHRCLQYPPHTEVHEGQTLYATGRTLKLCEYGLHASKRAIDALKYAPGPMACRVILSGEIKEGTDKACADERTCLKMADATNVLNEFACWCAEQVLLNERQQGREPDQRSWDAITAKRKWIKKEINDKELAAIYEAAIAAYNGAYNAARAAGRATYATAAEATAYFAARVAHNAATESTHAAYVAAVTASATSLAVDAAAYAVNIDNAYAAVRDKQNTKLEEMLNNLFNQEKETSNV